LGPPFGTAGSPARSVLAQSSKDAIASLSSLLDIATIPQASEVEKRVISDDDRGSVSDFFSFYLVFSRIPHTQTHSTVVKPNPFNHRIGCLLWKLCEADCG
jgi:hypothetical protein